MKKLLLFTLIAFVVGCEDKEPTFEEARANIYEAISITYSDFDYAIISFEETNISLDSCLSWVSKVHEENPGRMAEKIEQVKRDYTNPNYRVVYEWIYEAKYDPVNDGLVMTGDALYSNKGVFLFMFPYN